MDPIYIRRAAMTIEDRMKTVSLGVQRMVETLKDSKSIEDFLAVKKALLSYIVERLPLGITACPFCLEHGMVCGKKCKKCAYGKVHGMCVTRHARRKQKKTISDYDKIVLARDKLLAALSRYYEGEIYA